jgi:hypothetical protein
MNNTIFLVWLANKWQNLCPHFLFLSATIIDWFKLGVNLVKCPWGNKKSSQTKTRLVKIVSGTEKGGVLFMLLLLLHFP